jgi:uncharacterized damage-inducible protein DinB
MAAMTLTEACSNILSQLTDLVHQIREADFVKPAETLSYSTVGQHLRHTLEFFMCFEHGFKKGLINYDKRAHDKLIETDKFIALNAISGISEFVNKVDDKSLKLEVGYDLEKETYITIDTTATRELVYNIEHAVHHMAIMKIGIKEIAPYVQLSPDFGIAASTIRYKETSIATNY